MTIGSIISKESLESIPSMITQKRSSIIINEWDIAWILCGSLHVWLYTQLRFIAMDSSLIERLSVRP